MNRRRFLKYAGGVVVASAVAVSGYYLLPKPNEVATLQQTTVTNTTAQTITSEVLHNIIPNFDIGAAAGRVVSPLNNIINGISSISSQYNNWEKMNPYWPVDSYLALTKAQLPIISNLKDASQNALQETTPTNSMNLYSAFNDVKTQFQGIQNANDVDVNKNLDDWNAKHAAENPNDSAGKGTVFSDIERQMKDNSSKFNTSKTLTDLLQILGTNEAGLGYLERTSSAISSVSLVCDSMIYNQSLLQAYSQLGSLGLRPGSIPGGYGYHYGDGAIWDIPSYLQAMLTDGIGHDYSTTPIQGMEKWRRIHPLYKPTFNKILDELGKINPDGPAKVKSFVDNDESPYTLYPMHDVLSKYKQKSGYEGKAAQVISNGLTTGDINGLGSMLFMINPSTPPYDNVDGDIGDFFYEKNYTLLPDDHLKMSTEDVGKNVMNKMHTIFAVNENDINKHTTIAAWNNPSSMSSGTYGLIFVKTMKLAGRKVFDSTFYYNEKTGNAGGADISVAPIGNEFYVFHSYLNRVVKIPGDFSGFDDFVKNYDIFGTRHPQGVVQISEPFRDGGLTPATYSTKGILNSLPSPAGYPTS